MTARAEFRRLHDVRRTPDAVRNGAAVVVRSRAGRPGARIRASSRCWRPPPLNHACVGRTRSAAAPATPGMRKPLRDGRFRVCRRDPFAVIGDAGTAEEAVALVLGLLPTDPEPVIAVSADDHGRDQRREGDREAVAAIEEAQVERCRQAVDLHAVRNVASSSRTALISVRVTSGEPTSTAARAGCACADHVVHRDAFTPRPATARELQRHRHWPDSSNPRSFVTRNTAVDDSGPPISAGAAQ